MISLKEFIINYKIDLLFLKVKNIKMYSSQGSIQRICDSIHPNSIVLVVIGGSMKYYVTENDTNIENINNGYKRLVTRQNNQQYPMFLEKFGLMNRVIIIFDSELELDLKIPLPLHEIERATNPSNNILFRQLECDIDDQVTTVFAFHENYDYDNTYFMTRLIEICLLQHSKLIVQDFTGRDIISMYHEFLPIFGKEVMLSNILFDVTASTGDCLVEFVDEDCSLYPNGTFVNERCKRLVDLSCNTITIRVLQERLKVIINEISWIYLTKCKDQESDYTFPKKVYYLFNVYDIPEMVDTTERFGQLLFHLIRDVVAFHQCPPEAANHIISILHNRSEFLSFMQMLQFDL